jgi:hypothetical protein
MYMCVAQGSSLSLLNDLEREELLGGLRSMPARMPVALASAALLYLGGDMAGLWPLGWFALAPLCFACRGAGAIGALLLASVTFTLAAVSQSFWLLDVEGAMPVATWITAGVMPAIPLAAIELPIARKIPWGLRPLILAILATGFWALLPPHARMLVPCGGLIDSGLVSWLLANLDLATMAGCITGLGWLAAEMFATPRLAVKPRSGWAGLVLAGVLVLTSLVDWIGVTTALDSVRVDFAAPVVVVPSGDNLVEQSEELAPKGSATGVVVWRSVKGDGADRADWALKAGDLAEREQVVVALVVESADATWGYLFLMAREPAAVKQWTGGVIDEALTTEGEGILNVYPSFDAEPHWGTRWSLEMYVSPLAPVHPAQARWWLREQRRGALIRGSRQVAVWQGGGAAIDGRGRVIAQSENGEAFSAQLPATEVTGEALGHPRLQVVERILEFSAPVLALMLALLTPVSWGKRRWYARQRAAIGIEEVPDDTSTLSKEETEKITRSFKRED